LVGIKSRVTVCESKKEYENEKNAYFKSSKKTEQNGFSLPDGNWLDVTSISSECGEILFDPASFGYNNISSIQEIVKKSISECDKDIRG
jgi:hypothetical protein